ncbi:suppressor of fused domain protein [Nonomuraea muscovyensis]|uniref:Suppressor of fused-like domain-containing protein n=1 Tax=Nonomuraea muscovyensis TaxID=1124761 RepID=A0A7X0CCT8_9ACTN|nr:suppressor of fused domain protein [Nonomuraea muscovyensis]MBB6351840.1 hypothetical protein [Nonomuraea muscovyensis]
MAIFRSASGEGRTEVVLTAGNPYGSRTLVVERDEDASAAYLCSPDGTVHGAVWLANHRPAPATIDPARVSAGLPPVMHAPATTHPDGRRPLGPLTALWFEEGDGVAIYEDDDLLAVIPGWADMSRGMPGYARDAVGETPFAWALSEALEGLGPRLANARSYWRWRHSPGSWPSFQQFVLGHLDRVLGPAGRYWDVSGERLPTVGVTERPPHAGRAVTVLSTVGMSCQRMPTVEQWIDKPDAYARIELAVATRDDPREAALLLVWLSQYPWHSVTWLGHGHTAKWYHEPSTFPLGPQYAGVLMLADQPGMPHMSGFTFGGEGVRWLWLVPVTAQQLEEHRH